MTGQMLAPYRALKRIDMVNKCEIKDLNNLGRFAAIACPRFFTFEESLFFQRYLLINNMWVYRLLIFVDAAV